MVAFAPLIGIGARVAQVGMRGAAGLGKAAFTGKGIPGGIVGQKALEYGAVIPVLGAGATALGLPFGFSKPAPAAPPAGGMNQQQLDFMYGKQGFSFPWQGQEAFLDRQLRTQKEMFGQGQQTLRYTAGLNYALGSAGIAAQQRMADFSTQRQLQGLQDTNRTRVQLADRELSGLYDSNRTRVKIADIGSKTAMYQADRSVEVARWGGAPVRVATFGGLMGMRY